MQKPKVGDRKTAARACCVRRPDSLLIGSGKIALQFRIRNGILYAAAGRAAEFTGIGKDFCIARFNEKIDEQGE